MGRTKMTRVSCLIELEEDLTVATILKERRDDEWYRWDD